MRPLPWLRFSLLTRPGYPTRMTPAPVALLSHTVSLDIYQRAAASTGMPPHTPADSTVALGCPTGNWPESLNPRDWALRAHCTLPCPCQGWLKTGNWMGDTG